MTLNRFPTQQINVRLIDKYIAVSKELGITKLPHSTISYFFFLLSVLSFNLVVAQSDTPIEQVAASHLLQNQSKWSLTDEDVANFSISSYHTSKHSGVTHIYVNQDINGISIHNAMAVINVKKDNSLLLASSDFLPDAKSKVSNKKQASLSPEDAIQKYCEHHNLPLSHSIKKNHTPTTINNEYIYEKTSFSEGNLYATLLYYLTDDKQLQLVWRIEINENKSPDFWVSYVNAHSGQIIHSENQTNACQFHEHALSDQPFSGVEQQSVKSIHRQKTDVVNKKQHTTVSAVDGSNYLVYAFPLEHPNQGEQTVVTQPFLPEASPFGWHDIDGAIGPEFTITRGNNVHAFQSTAGTGISEEDEPDGGPSLNFNFVHDKLGEPTESLEADVTQLFYTTNWAHDFAYFFGFDEEAGNYQENNYGNDGADGDYVISEALDSLVRDSVLNTNNAFFSRARDGQHGLMTMLPFVSSGFREVNLLAPLEKEYLFGRPFFGTPDAPSTVSGLAVISIDSGDISPFDACDPIINASEIAGKVALVNRGNCAFSFKVNNLQNAGAIAVLICNRDEEIVGMLPGTDAELVTIQSAHLRKSDCDTLKAFIEQNAEVNLQFVFDLFTPEDVSGSFDNGLVMHEYGHGITFRLAGGRNTVSCLDSDEQMGEGWSDFFGIVATHKPTDFRESDRTIATYGNDRANNTIGFRRQPYSTDFSVNTQTYNDIRFTGFSSDTLNTQRTNPHSVGEIWTGALWDMYWSFIDRYGYNEDWTDRSSGNSRAIQLVFDGLKLQKCNPGFIDARDAILAADEALFSGENQCLIWEVFARRGLGYDAIQGSANDREDNQEGFLVAPACQNQLVINKTATEVIRAGDLIDVALIIENNTGSTLTNVLVTDVVPEGTLPIALNETTDEFDENTGEVIFNLSEMEPLDVIRINYQLETTREIRSTLNPFVNNSIVNFNPISLAGDQVWNLVPDPDFGSIWTIEGELSEYDQVLEFGSTISVTGRRPGVLFTHNFDTELFFASGDVEISTDNGNEWISVRRDQILTGGYTDDIFFKERDEFGFTGDSNGFMQTTIDLTEYIDQNILLRFRYLSVITEPIARFTQAKDGWTICAIEFIDLTEYDLNEACVSSAQLDTECDGASTVIESGTSKIIREERFGFKLFPNPATDLIQFTIEDIDRNSSTVRLFRSDGRVIIAEPLTNFGRSGTFTIPLPPLAAGLYIMEVDSPEGKFSEMLSIIQE